MANAVTRLLFDPVAPDRERVPRRYQFTGDARWWTVALGAGLALLAVGAAVGVAAGMQRFLYAYLIGWTFCVSIALGSLLWVMIQHITKARWSTTVRRIPEAIAANLPLLALAGLPVLFGTHSLYHWSHAELYQPGAYFDPILAGKAGYFFAPFAAGTFPFFFVLRYVVFFAVWIILARKLYSLSVESDTRPDPALTLRMRKVSAIGIPLVGVTFAFAGFDWLMSTDPHWFSTMFGVYFFAGGWLGAICLITFLALLLKKGGMVDQEITHSHIHDLGRYMLAFTIFWTYIGFSQYMLYWYANLAEETIWFAKRFTGGWMTVTLALVLGHFLVPFFVLLLRISKRVYPVLATMAVWLLVMHFVDLWWVTSPSMLPTEGEHVEEHAARPVAPDTPVRLVAQVGDGLEGTGTDSETAVPGEAISVDNAPTLGTGGLGSVQAGETVPQATDGLSEGQPAAEFRPTVLEPAVPVVEFLTWLGLFGLLVGATLLRLSRHALTPYGDPYFADALRFEVE